MLISTGRSIASYIEKLLSKGIKKAALYSTA
jgi:hypothetical protein